MTTGAMTAMTTQHLSALRLQDSVVTGLDISGIEKIVDNKVQESLDAIISTVTSRVLEVVKSDAGSGIIDKHPSLQDTTIPALPMDEKMEQCRSLCEYIDQHISASDLEHVTLSQLI